MCKHQVAAFKFNPLSKIKKNIFVINGSAGSHSANEKLILEFGKITADEFNLRLSPGLKTLPHFNPEQASGDTPETVLDFRRQLEAADGVLICTPEYVFSLPAGLKNALEWCVATTVFTDKPTGLITASAQGQKGHEALQLILRTMMASFTADTTLLIPGIKAKFDEDGHLNDEATRKALADFAAAFSSLLRQAPN